MKAFGYSAVLFVGISLSACAVAEPLPTCSAGLTPTSTVAPKLPPRLHNEFSGTAQVSFVIDTSGQVQSPSIVSAEWHPFGRSTGDPVGYDEAVLSAVSRWRYPHRQQACSHQVPIKLQVEGSSTTAGRPNQSFKPTPSARLNSRRWASNAPLRHPRARMWPFSTALELANGPIRPN